MATYYFRNTAADQDWFNQSNWWDDPIAGTNNYTPTSSDDVVIMALCEVAASVPTVNNATLDGSHLTIELTVNGTFTIINGGYIGDGVTIINGNVICSSGGVVGLNGSYATINGNLTFEGTGITETGSSNTAVVSGDVIFAADWTGTASYISATNAVYNYGSTGTASNLTLSGNSLYAGYPTLYYNNAANDSEWNNNLNWWVDSGYTQQSYDIPTSSTTVYINADVATDSSSSATADTAFVNGVFQVSFTTIDINLTITNDITFYYSKFGASTIDNRNLSANNVLFSDSDNYGTVNFGTECRFEYLDYCSTNYGTVSANGNGAGSTFFDGCSINAGTVGVGATAYTVDFSDASTNTGTVNIDTNVNYPVNRNTFNSGTISGAITYNDYPALFYFYGGADWNNISYWWTDSGHTTQAGYVPGSLDDVVLESDIYATATNMYANNITVDYAGELSNTSYSINAAGTITFDNGALGSSSATPLVVVANSAVFNNSSSVNTYGNLSVATSVDFNDTSALNGTVTGNANFYDNSGMEGMATLNGNATIYFPHPLPFNFTTGINGTITYSGYPTTAYYNNASNDGNWNNVNNWWTDDQFTVPFGSIPDSTIDVFINGDVSQNSGPQASVDALTVVSGTLSISIECNSASFLNSSICSGSIAVVSEFGTATFSDSSSNNSGVSVVSGNIIFEDNSSNTGSITLSGGAVDVYYPVVAPLGGTITGASSVNYHNYTTLYFNGSTTADWNDLNNWWVDSGFTVKSADLPGYGTTVYISSNVWTNSGSPAIAGTMYVMDAQVGIDVAVSNNVFFGGSSVFGWNDPGSPAVVLSASTGTVTFYGTSTNELYATVNASVIIFQDSATNKGTINTSTGIATIEYPVNRNNFNTGSILFGGNPATLTYTNYPSNFYFYGGNDWNNLSYWWTDSGHSTQAGYVPGSLDDVIIEADFSSTTGTVYANSAVVNNTTINGATIEVTNTITFNSSTLGYTSSAQVVASSAVFQTTSLVDTYGVVTVSSTASFDSTSNHAGYIAGNVDVLYPHAVPFDSNNGNTGTITGTITYSGYTPRTLYFFNTGSGDTDWANINNWWEDSAHTIQAGWIPYSLAALDNVIVESSVLSNSGSSANATVNTLTVNAGDLDININCDSANFNNSSSFSLTTTASVLTQNGNTSGVTFSDLSSNNGTIIITSPGVVFVVFEDSATMNFGTITGDAQIYYPVALPFLGNISGTTTYYGYPAYFNDSNNASNGDWNDPDNWFLDSPNTVPAGAVPTETYPGVNVILQQSVTNSSGGTPTAYDLTVGYICSPPGDIGSNISLDIAVTVNGLATFISGCYITSPGYGVLTGTINGNALFDGGFNNNGTISGLATFSLPSAEFMINGGYDGTYNGGIEFKYGKGVNGSSILGIV